METDWKRGMNKPKLLKLVPHRVTGRAEIKRGNLVYAIAIKGDLHARVLRPMTYEEHTQADRLAMQWNEA